MIDVVICHTDSKLAAELEHDIASTCGTNFIMHAIDNSDGRHDIFTAYDSGIKECRQDIIVCCHQDIRFKSENWGVLLEKYFSENPQLGAIGVAGGSAHSKVPGSWFTAPPECKRLINIIQHDRNGKIFHDCTIDSKVPLYPAAVIDGVFMAFRKSVFENISFVRSGMSGFHGYDIDISLQLKKAEWQIAVSSEILIEHFSMGRYSAKYIENIIETHKQNAMILPFSADGNISDIRGYETLSLYFFVCTMLETEVPARVIFSTVIKNLKYCTLFCKGAVLLGGTLLSLLFRKK